MEGYVPVLAEGDLAVGAMAAVEVDGDAVCVARVDAGLFAFDDRCPHRGTPLSLGRLNATTLTCSAHTWEFDVTTGRLLRIRAPACLAMRPVRVRAGMIEVGG